MANRLPSFQSSAQLAISIDGKDVAYCQNLTWSDDVSTVPVSGIGSFSYHALEPTSYMARGSLTITHFSQLAATTAQSDSGAPANMPASATTSQFSQADTGTSTKEYTADGNSLLKAKYFSPIYLITSRTFDITIKERRLTPNYTGGVQDPVLSYTLADCRFTSLSMSFTPGSLLNQTLSFICMSVTDHAVENQFKKFLNT